MRAAGVVYFAASVDSADINRRFADSLGLAYPILSDPTKEVARAYGVLASTGYPSRWTFLVGEDGRILDIDKTVKASTHGRDLAERVQRSTFNVQGSGSRSGSGSS